MSRKYDDGRGVSRRAMLGAVGSAAGAAMFAGTAATATARLASTGNEARFIRELGAADLCCSAPGMTWADFDGQRIVVSLTTTGRPVRLTARVPLDYGGPEGSGVGISFAEDGVDLHRSTERGLAYTRIESGTIASATLEATTVRLVPAGRHTWTLRVRHENPLSGGGAQQTYCRTRRIAPLEVTAVEL